MPLAVNDLIQATYYGTLYGQKILTVLHLRISETVSIGTVTQDLQGIATAMADEDDTAQPLYRLIAMQSQDVLQNYVRVQRISPVRTIYVTAVTNIAGNLTQAAGAANIAGSLTKRSLTVGRNGVGRVQVAGIPPENGEAGIWGATQLGRMDALGAQLILEKTVLAGDIKFRFCMPTYSTTGAFDVFEANSQDTMRTMHRRTVRLGE